MRKRVTPDYIVRGIDAEIAVVAEPGTRLADIEICGFEISYVRMIAADEVQFIDADGYLFTTVSGWVYSPNRMPNGSDNREFSSTHLGGPW